MPYTIANGNALRFKKNYPTFMRMTNEFFSLHVIGSSLKHLTPMS